MTVYGQENKPGKDMWGYDLNPGCSWPYNSSIPSPTGYYSSDNSYYSSASGVTSDSNYSDHSSNSNGHAGLSKAFISVVLSLVGLGSFSALLLPKINPSVPPQDSAPSVPDYL